MKIRSIIRAPVIIAVIILSLVLYAGSSFSLDSLTLLTTLMGANAMDEFIACSSAGDVNGDGFNDIIVGATQMTLDRGYAYIYFGGPEFDTIPDVRLFGEVDSLMPGYFGFGSLVACAGDVNNDGYDDVVVASKCFCDMGKVFLYFGGADMDSVEDVVFELPDDRYMFASSISSAGDVNNDGYDDVIIGSPEYPSGLGIGRAYIYFGGDYMDDEFDVCIQGDTGSALGASVKAGDINNDGYDDILIGAPYDGATHFEGRASIYFGGNPMDTLPDVTFWGDSTDFQHAGGCISGAGDVNGDNYPDVMIVGNYDNRKLRIFYGGPLMDTIPDVLLGGSHAICAAGDLNKDGFGDIMVSGTIFYGGDPMDTVPDLALPTGGMLVAGAGDINADGYDEVLLSVYGDSTARGVVYIFTSCPSSVSDAEEEQFPNRFQLNQNYPNPFNPQTEIVYELPFDCQVRLTVYNVLGQRVVTLVDEFQNAGTKTFLWNGKNAGGHELPSGIYFYKIDADGFKQARKMVILK